MGGKVERELHIISTGKQPLGQLIEIMSTIHPYIDGVHLREKHLSACQLFKLVQDLAEKGVPRSKIYINDRVDVALTAQTKGIQLTYQSLDSEIVKRKFPTLRVGCSVHSIDEAVEKEKRGADFLIYGHVFETASKPGLPPRGINHLARVCDSVSIPVLAIGGIHLDNLQRVLRTNAGGIAVMSGVLVSANPKKAAQDYYRLLKEF